MACKLSDCHSAWSSINLEACDWHILIAEAWKAVRHQLHRRPEPVWFANREQECVIRSAEVEGLMHARNLASAAMTLSVHACQATSCSTDLLLRTASATLCMLLCKGAAPGNSLDALRSVCLWPGARCPSEGKLQLPKWGTTQNIIILSSLISSSTRPGMAMNNMKTREAWCWQSVAIQWARPTAGARAPQTMLGLQLTRAALEHGS